MIRNATLSSCGRFRTSLTRALDYNCKLNCCKNGTLPRNSGYALFICNNPSTADAETDDASIRRMWAFTRSWGYNLMMVGNTNCFRATDPKLAKPTHETVSQINDSWLVSMHRKSGVTVCAWGDDAHQGLVIRAVNLLRPIGALHMLRLTKAGNPWHPLYLPGTLTPQLWRSQT